MITLTCKNISKAYIAENIIEDISFSVNDNEHIALVGLNGAGKTTLFKILTGELSHDAGSINTSKNFKIAYLQQNTKITSENNIFDELLLCFSDLIELEKNIRNLEIQISKFSETDNQNELARLMDSYTKQSEEFEERDGYSYNSKIKGVLKGLGFDDTDFSKSVNNLSGGQKSRIMLGKLLLQDADLLLLDEPTNHLDIEAISWLEKYLRDYKKAFIIISHDRYFLDNTVNRVLLLEKKHLNSYNGNYTTFMKKRKIEIEQRRKEYEAYEKDVKKQEELIEKLHNYGSQRNIRQAFSRQKSLEKMKKIDKPNFDNKKVHIRFTPKTTSGRDVLKTEKLCKSYGEHEIFRDISFSIYRGEKIGIIGPNGIGKSTLLKAICSKLLLDSGEINFGHHVFSSYYDQEQNNLDFENTVIDEIWDELPSSNYYEIRSLLSQFLFGGDDLYKIVNDLSGGEKGRLSLLKLMVSESNFLLMDEPTNHLDIDSKEILEEALQYYDGTALIVSHDRYFLNKVATKIFDMSKDGIFEYLGNYDYYLYKKAELEATDDEIVDIKTKTQIQNERKKERQEINKKRKIEKEILSIENDIAEHEKKISHIENLLCLQETYSDTDKVLELNNEMNKHKESLNNLYEKWESLN